MATYTLTATLDDQHRLVITLPNELMGQVQEIIWESPPLATPTRSTLYALGVAKGLLAELDSADDLETLLDSERDRIARQLAGPQSLVEMVTAERGDR